MPTLIPTGAMYGAEAYCIDKTSEWYGWLFRKWTPDGEWVPHRDPGPTERIALEAIVKSNLSNKP